MAEQQRERHTLKRRGLIAGAAALVAGIAAKQTARPVSAGITIDNVFQSSGPNDGINTADFRAAGTTHYGYYCAGSFLTGVYGTGSSEGVFGFTDGGNGVKGLSASGDGVMGESSSGAGVNGYSTSSYGVYATSSATTAGGAPAIYGTNTSGNNAIGVRGVVGTTGIGVKGESDLGIGIMGKVNGGYGVQGIANAGYGVVGTSSGGPAVYGTNTSGADAVAIFGYTGTYGTAVYGSNLLGYGVYGASTGGVGTAGIGIGGGIGVYGVSASGTGIYGQTSASNQYGILGTTYAANSTAIAGTCTGDGSSAFSGGTTNPNAFAGVFQGNVVIGGRLVVSDPSYKSGALAHPDGTHRLVYCVESPESWIEDVGKGQLVNGTATVKFDKDFAAVTHTDEYHVFLTEYGGNNALYVDKRNATGFEVHADKPGASSTFSWKVMVKAKSGVKSERLGKFTMPNLPLPDPAKFKVPEPPAVVPKKP